MSVMWGIHNDQPQLDFVGDGVISLGWDEVSDVRDLGNDKEVLKTRLSELYPEAKPGAIPVWAGVLLRFAFEMKPVARSSSGATARGCANHSWVAGGFGRASVARTCQQHAR